MSERKPTREELDRAAAEFERLSKQCKAAAEGRDSTIDELVGGVQDVLKDIGDILGK